MELRDFLHLFYRERLLYGVIIFTFLLLGWGWSSLQPVEYEAKLLLTVGRTEGVTSSDYSYDSFYRLQADERFADTLVKLLETSRVTEDIFSQAEVSPSRGEGYFVGRRLSSQAVEVSYRGTSTEVLTKLGMSVPQVLSRYTDELNREAVPNENWFRVVAATPVIEDGRIEQRIIFVVTLFLGLFVGFWVIVFRHYLRKP